MNSVRHGPIPLQLTVPLAASLRGSLFSANGIQVGTLPANKPNHAVFGHYNREQPYAGGRSMRANNCPVAREDSRCETSRIFSSSTTSVIANLSPRCAAAQIALMLACMKSPHDLKPLLNRVACLPGLARSDFQDCRRALAELASCLSRTHPHLSVSSLVFLAATVLITAGRHS